MREAQWPLRSLFWEATLRCNAFCAFCGSRCGETRTEELPAEVYEMAERILRDGTDDVPEGVIFQSMRPLGKVWKKVNTDYFCFE